jgi:hypothetical protein
MMSRLKSIRAYLLACSLVVVLQPIPGFAQSNSAAAKTDGQTFKQQDGQHDFDFEIGTWKTHVKRLLHPLTGSNTWVEYDGTTIVRKVWNGRANLVELVMDGPAGHFEGLSLRLYNPETRQWSLNFSNINSGTLSQPTIGEFKNGRGEFYDQETLNGRAIFVRFVITDITPNSCRFEQSFSDDGGRTWELNWIATDTRVKGESLRQNSHVSKTSVRSSAGEGDGQHDFDWEFGNWKIHIKRLQHPFTGSTTWTELDGTVAVRKIWGGRANLAEIEADGPAGHLQFLSLRLYNPQSHQWSLNFASSNSDTLSVPMMGEFKNGLGEFYDQEPFNERAILVRFTFSAVSSNSGHSEQAFSNDGGKTWETNWINTYDVKNESDK